MILKATRQHARNLATYVFLYKAIMLVLKYTPRPFGSEDKEATYDTFLAGLAAGYAVFGRGIQSSVNQQIVTYVFARVMLGLAKLSVKEGGMVPKTLRPKLSKNAWPIFASLSWAAIMWLFRWHPDVIQPSLKSSMTYLCEAWLPLGWMVCH